MAKNTVMVDEPILKFERIFEDDYTKEVWKYDFDKSKFGPIEVVIHYKSAYNFEKKSVENTNRLAKKQERKLKKSIK